MQKAVTSNQPGGTGSAPTIPIGAYTENNCAKTGSKSLYTRDFGSAHASGYSVRAVYEPEDVEAI
jgi:hypothetical protein